LNQDASRSLSNNWITVAGRLGNGRTHVDCLMQYQRYLNKNFLRSKWTPDEDELLKRVVRFYGPGKWQLVAMHMEGRTGQQCLHRWTRSLDNTVKKKLGKWEPNEDDRLKDAVGRLGCRNWAAIAEWVPGRTDVQCRERWSNILDPKLQSTKNLPWTIEEDAKLLEIAPRLNFKWSAISTSAFHPRTDNQCARRWKYLQKPAKYKRKQREQLEKVLEKKLKASSEDLSMPNVSGTIPDDYTEVPASSMKISNIPKRRLEQIARVFSYPGIDSASPGHASFLDFPVDPYNVQSLQQIWHFLKCESPSYSDMVDSAFDFDRTVHSAEYAELLQRFKTLYIWPLLLALIPDDSS
jgi:hypothetical protein